VTDFSLFSGLGVQMDGYRLIYTLATVLTQHKITCEGNHFYWSLISGYRREVAENCLLLGYNPEKGSFHFYWIWHY